MLIPVLNGAPAEPIPPDAILVHCDGTHYHVYFEGDTIPPGHQPQPPQPQLEPDWLAFRLAIFQDSAYQQVRLATAPAALSAFETEVRAADTYLPMLPVLWAGVLALTLQEARPTAEDYEQWNAVATATNIPISWDANGILEVL